MLVLKNSPIFYLTIPFNTPILRLTPLTTPNGIRSNQPFFRNSPTGQTDRPTDGIGDKPVPTSAYALLYHNDAANNCHILGYDFPKTRLLLALSFFLHD